MVSETGMVSVLNLRIEIDMLFYSGFPRQYPPISVAKRIVVVDEVAT